MLTACRSAPRDAVLPLLATLDQVAGLVASLTDEQYRLRPIGPGSGSIGGHVRHCLDHVESLLAGVATGRIDYDQRQRGTDVETCRGAALDAVHRQTRQLLDLTDCSWHHRLRLSVLLSSCGPSVEVTTSLGRELAFVLSHTVHHNALLAVMARTLGVPLPEGFGYAPSTIAHLEKAACVR